MASSLVRQPGAGFRCLLLRSPAGLVATLVATLAASCALKKPPDAAAVKEQALPTLQTPAQWTAAGAGAGTVADNWVAGFHDDQLSAAVAEAIAHNADLRVGAARVEQALLYAKLAGAKLYPSVDLLAHGGTKMGDGTGLSGVALNATWELDLWGRVRYGRAASGAQATSAQADFEYARQSIAALVARSWFLATEAGLQVEAARETIRASDELVRLAGDRVRIGVGGQEDVFVARASVGTYRDVLRQLELAREQAIRSLELVLGRYPSAAAAPAPQLPGVPREIPAGLPSELLERRPDVVAAERRVAAAFNRIHEAKAARLPAIALTTGVSSISSDLFVLKDHSNPVWSLGGNLLAPIYQGWRAQDSGRDSDGRAETGDRRVCSGGNARLWRGGRRTGRRDCRARARGDPDADARRQSAGAHRGAEPVQGREYPISGSSSSGSWLWSRHAPRSSGSRPNSGCSA